MYASFTSPIGSKATRDWNVGLSTLITADVPGELGFGIQWGNFGGGADLRYFHKLDSGWYGSHALGWLTDQKGSGWSLSTRWSVLQDITFSVGTQMTWYQELPFQALVEANIEIPFDETLSAFGEARWSLADQNVGLNTGLFWQTEPWGLEFSGDVTYDYANTLQPVSFDLRLKGIYSFDWQTPEHITQNFGGRNSGRISGLVQGGGIPIPDVVLEIDRYKLLTDAEGRFSADLPPGDYTLKLDKSTLPITFRLVTEEEVAVTIPLQREIQVDFDTVATAALSGRVLLDADGDGKADEPATGAEAQFVLEDVEGLRRVVKTNVEGSFLVRGLLPGKSVLKLTGLPFGSQVVGASEETLVLKAGQVSEVSFVVQPPTTLSQDFSDIDLRIRRVKIEVDQIPAGTAPLVQVSIQGEPDQVLLKTEKDQVELSLKDEVWEGRLPIPLDTPEGVFAFVVIAKQGQGQIDKKSQVIVNPEVPALEVTLSSPVKPTETLRLDVLTYFEATTFNTSNELGLIFDLQGSNGVYQAEVLVPEGILDKIYPFSIEVSSSLGATFKQDATFRVLVVE